jgi:hypothetical protein
MKSRSFAAFLLLTLIGCQQSGMWPRLKGLDSSLTVLDDPPRLLAIASNYDGPPGQPWEHPLEPTISTRHEALRALLSLQCKRFRVALVSVNAKNTTGIDHICVETMRSDSNSVTLLATPSLLAERKAPEGDYWNMEELTFEKSGRLISRQPYIH